MKNPTALQTVHSVGTLDRSEAVAMGIDAEGMNIIMSTLSNMYSNGHEAIVREYACNARDSHVEAREARPIEITLPSALDPQFKVQDWGLGLSKQGILKTYAQYGASTKRDSNEMIGAFGIGSKSAFTVGQMFTVTAVKDGEKTIAMFSLSETGLPTVQILHNGDTDEPNGVLVDIGVEDVNAVLEAAAKIFPHWEPGTVLINGLDPDFIWDHTSELANGVYVDLESGQDKHSYQVTHFKVLMGGVPYSIPLSLWSNLSGKAVAFKRVTDSTKATFILDVPIGSVDITPNREELRDTKRTQATVGAMLERAADALGPWMETQVNSAPNIWEASRVYRDLSLKLNYRVDPSSVRYGKGNLGKATIELQYPILMRTKSTRYGATNYKIKSHTGYVAHIVSTDFENTLFVTNVPEDKQTTVRAYARAVLTSDDNPYTALVIAPAQKENIDWFSYGEGTHSTIPHMSFTDFHAYGKELRPKRVGVSKSATKYNTVAKGDDYSHDRTAAEIADLDLTVLYRSRRGKEFNTRYNSFHAAVWENNDLIIASLTGPQKISVLAKNLALEEEDIQHVAAYLHDAAEEAMDNFTEEDHNILKIQARSENTDNNEEALRFLRKHIQYILNPAVIKEFKDSQAVKELTEEQKTRLGYLTSVLNELGATNPYDITVTKQDFFASKLPLFHAIQQNQWGCARALEQTDIDLDRALIDYINDTVIV